jgi:hypothetical protein
MTLFFLSLLLLLKHSLGLNVVIAGGTGKLGKLVATKLIGDKVTILCRNSFLAAAPNKVTEAFGWVGASFLERNPHVKLRDWDGGDLLDIVGQDWVGWQDDALAEADVVVNLCGGYTKQRNMATERIVRESLRVNPRALQLTVSPMVEDLKVLTPGMVTMKTKRLQECEDMVQKNCINSKCLRLEAYNMPGNCQQIIDAIRSAKP